MEFLVVNTNKLKIILDKEEMETYGLAAQSAESDTPQIRRSLWRLLDAANERCGFNTAGDKVLIQYYSLDGGAEIFVTKIGRIGADAERTLSRSKNVTMLLSKRRIYRFHTARELTEAAGRLGKFALERTCDLYYSDDACFYLLCDDRSSAGVSYDLSVLSEFAYEVPSSLEVYIREHSRLLIENNALRVLSELRGA